MSWPDGDDCMNGFNTRFTSINQVTDQYLNRKDNVKNLNTKDGLSFQEVLEKTRHSGAIEILKFSKHATQRLDSRNIELTDNQINRLEEGMQKARDKGINDSLVILDDLAFIVNVPNNTVVTAINQNEAHDKIFTNIDGAVII